MIKIYIHYLHPKSPENLLLLKKFFTTLYSYPGKVFQDSKHKNNTAKVQAVTHPNIGLSDRRLTFNGKLVGFSDFSKMG